MKRIILLFMLTTGLLLAACQEFDIANPNEATLANFWKSESDAIAGVNSVYSTLHRGSISRWMPFYYIIRSDEGRSTSPATDIVNNMDQFLVTDYNYGNAYGIWNDLYVGIFRANQVLDNVPNITMDNSVQKRVLGEAQFMRALFYYQLVSLWGNVPLMLHASTPEDLPPTASVEEVWAQIEADLTDASINLPTFYPNDADLGRATSGAARALLAKALMQQQKYGEALVPLEWLVEGEGASIYDLTTNYRDNFLESNENNVESIFEWQFEFNPSENHDDDTDPRVDNLNYGSSLPQFFGPAGVGWSDGEAHRWLVYEFTDLTIDGDRDPRLEASLLFDSTSVLGPDVTEIYGQSFTARYGSANKRVWFRKFQNDDWKDFEGYNSPNNWRYIRYADVLLLYAEALNAEGQTVAAYEYVNRVRNRADLADLPAGLSQTAFLEQLKHERITELSGEGHRWNDLARWGDLGPGLSVRDPGFANFEVGKHELLPIPQQERDINPNLEQNDNW